MDVTDWLRGLGLERYAAAFRENEVSADLLPTLTAQDLQDMGVVAVGHRRRLQDAIAALAGDQPTRPATGATSGDRPSPERRRLTVLFCDLVGSTPLSTRLDPEDLREILDIYRASVLAAVTDKHGYVAKYFGDGVLAYFGWPNPDEAHADSAVRAGLAAIEALRPHQLPVRIGIATGLVVVGDLIGTGASEEHPAIGETPNLAARLQALAEPDTIVVSEATRSQLGRMFEVEALGPITLKGFHKSVNAWRVRGETGASSRSEAVYVGGLTPLVGRDEELDLLLRRWQQAKAGEGRVVLLSGEAGIGKSRLLAALEERLAGEPHVSLRYFCSPHHQDSALYPITARLEQEAGFSRGDTAEHRLAKLEAVLAPTAPPPDDVALLASLLSIPPDAGYPALELSPRRRKERTLAALIRRLTSFARSGPVLLLFEDAHWSDPTSLELLDAVVGQIAEMPVLLVVAYRPDFSPPWFDRPGASSVALNRLDRRDATALAAQVAMDHALSQSLLDRIVVQADGVPLFIEELTKAVQEASELDAASTLAVPDTLQASLMARLDRLPAAKQVAQIGSVIGREFSHPLIVAAARMPEPLLAQGLGELLASGLAFRRGTPPDAVYLFKHALVQDVAYESLLRSRRAEVHARIAEMLESEGDDAGSKLALVGYHCANAGLIEKAAACYCSAGERLSEKAGFVETERLLRRGLALAETLPESPRRRLLEAELWGALANIVSLTKGSTHPDTALWFERGVELFRRHDDVASLSRALYHRSFHRMQRGDHEAARDDARELMEIAEASRNVAGRSIGHVLLMLSSLLGGRFEAARANARSALELGRTNADGSVGLILGVMTVEVTARLFSAFSLGCLGYLEQSAAEYARTVEQTGQLGPTGRAIFSINFARMNRIVFRDKAAFREHAAASASSAAELGLPQYVLAARLNQGWLAVQAGAFETGVAEMRAALQAMHAVNYVMWIQYCYFLLADAFIFSGRHEEALVALHQGLTLAVRPGEVWLDAELHRLWGELLLNAAERDQAEHHLRQAIRIARGQSAKLFELRAATSLARFWSGQGRRAEARELLAPVYDWFTEGFGSVDLQETRAVLAELGEARPSHRQG